MKAAYRWIGGGIRRGIRGILLTRLGTLGPLAALARRSAGVGTVVRGPGGGCSVAGG